MMHHAKYFESQIFIMDYLSARGHESQLPALFTS